MSQLSQYIDPVREENVRIPAGPVILDGILGSPAGRPHGVVIFAHGSGSGRLSPRNQFVARELRKSGLASLLVDLLTPEEEVIDLYTAKLRFDIGLLAGRLIAATDWLSRGDHETTGFPIGYFGASTGAAAALHAAVERRSLIRAVVSRGGRPDLADAVLHRVDAPTLFVVGGNDLLVLRANQEAFRLLGAAPKDFAIIPGATHLFEEPGALDDVARLAAAWFVRFLGQASGAEPSHPAGRAAGRR